MFTAASSRPTDSDLFFFDVISVLPQRPCGEFPGVSGQPRRKGRKARVKDTPIRGRKTWKMLVGNFCKMKDFFAHCEKWHKDNLQ